tara:strand:- start:1539 stop:1778 length:240 start_codon:yes stop_codon:yes gene_type:complete
MGKPIYRVIIDYGYKKKGSVRKFAIKKIDTFVLTNVEEEIKKDEGLLNKMARRVNKKPEQIDIIFKKIYIEGQYGETSY